ncbi:MAG: hypothetical protein P8J89_09405 [Phycisphaerales bacterium]|nr:hypothetical protein [Phycisphaerales bacterium]|tara:strand:+ start:164 stop:829 length:666 start_codon:yes stop_codon:yes gene_type:complete
MKRFATVLGCVSAVALSSTAMAGFIVEDFADYHDQANTMYGAWDTFTQANNAPNFADNGGNMGFNGQVFNFSGTAFIASSGNIYDPASALNIHNYLTLENVDITNAQVNVATMGVLPDLGNVIFQAVTSAGDTTNLDTSTYSENFLNEIPGFGATTNLSWSFDLSDIAGDVTSIAFIMSATGSNMSLDALSLDVAYATVPAPGALALLGLAGIAGRRRRRG